MEEVIKIFLGFTLFCLNGMIQCKLVHKDLKSALEEMSNVHIREPRVKFPPIMDQLNAYLADWFPPEEQNLEFHLWHRGSLRKPADNLYDIPKIEIAKGNSLKHSTLEIPPQQLSQSIPTYSKEPLIPYYSSPSDTKQKGNNQIVGFLDNDCGEYGNGPMCNYYYDDDIGNNFGGQVNYDDPSIYYEDYQDYSEDKDNKEADDDSKKDDGDEKKENSEIQSKGHKPRNMKKSKYRKTFNYNEKKDEKNNCKKKESKEEKEDSVSIPQESLTILSEEADDKEIKRKEDMKNLAHTEAERILKSLRETGGMDYFFMVPGLSTIAAEKTLENEIEKVMPGKLYFIRK